MQGNYTVVNRGWNWAIGTVSQHTYKDMLEWNKLGFLTISSDKKYDNFKKGKGFTFSQFQEHMDGVQKKITVHPTQSGLKYKHTDNPNWLKYPTVNSKLTKLLRMKSELKESMITV